MIYASRQTDRHANRNTSRPSQRRSKKEHSVRIKWLYARVYIAQLQLCLYSENAAVSPATEYQRQLSPDSGVSTRDDNGYLVPDDDDAPASPYTVTLSSRPPSHDIEEPTTVADDDQRTNLYLHILSVAGVKVAGR